MQLKIIETFENIIINLRNNVIYIKITYLFGMAISIIAFTVLKYNSYYHIRLMTVISVTVAALLFLLTTLISKVGLDEKSIKHYSRTGRTVGILYLLCYLFLLLLFYSLILFAGIFSVILPLTLLI